MPRSIANWIILRYATPKMQYYVVSQLGRRLIDLGLGPAALAFTGVNGNEERALAGKVMLAHPEDVARGMAASERPAGMGPVSQKITRQERWKGRSRWHSGHGEARAVRRWFEHR